MKTIAVANQKGGVAKTTTTYNLAAVKAMEGKRVLMIDLDPQCSLTIAAGIEPGSAELEGFSTCGLFNKKTDVEDCVFKVDATGLDNLYIVPSDIDLAEMEMQLFTKASREKQLKRAISKLEEYFDYVFIDCPPQLGTLTINALVAADEVVIPCKTEYLAYRGLRALLDTIESVQEDDDLNPDLKLLGIIATLYEKQIKDQRDVLDLLHTKGSVLGIVKKTADAYRGQISGLPAVMVSKKSDASIAYVEIASKI